MKIFNSQFDRFAQKKLLIGLCAVYFVLVSTSAQAQRFLIEPMGLNAVSEEQVVEIVQSRVFGGRTAETVLQDLQKLAELKLDQLEVFCNLTPEQRRRLKIAAAGDASRFLHDVSRLSRKLGRELEGKNIGEVELIKIFQACSTLSGRLQSGLYRTNSLFEKVRVSILDKEQIEKHADLLRSGQTKTRVLSWNPNLFSLE